MTDIQQLHRKAMDLAEAAAAATVRGKYDRAASLLEQAFVLETGAAKRCANQLEFEPTRSVLHRSAASLALETGHVREAEEIIATALAGNPPEEIATELRELLQDVYARNVQPGDSVEVHQRIREGPKERIQIFAGDVVARKGVGIGATFTVRQLLHGEGVERVFLIHSPTIAKIVVKPPERTQQPRLFDVRKRNGQPRRTSKKDKATPAKATPNGKPTRP